MRKDVMMGDGSLSDSMVEDGLKDAIGKYVMGETAENVAEQWQITRQQQVCNYIFFIINCNSYK